VKRPNYNAAKRAREERQKAKRNAKLARKQSRAAAVPPPVEALANPQEVPPERA